MLTGFSSIEAENLS